MEKIHAFLSENRESLIQKIVERHTLLNPELYQKYDSRQKKASRRDVGFHLDYLVQSLLYESPEIFCDYTHWLKVYLPRVGVKEKDILDSLECLKEVIGEEAPKEYKDRVSQYAEEGIKYFQQSDSQTSSFLEKESAVSVLATQYMNALLRGDRRTAVKLIMDESDSGRDIQSIYMDIIQPVQYEIGRLWQTNKISVAHEHFCSAAAQLIMSQLYSKIFTGEGKDKIMVAHCVSGELHEIGARMVADLFEMGGWDTYYLGANTPASSVVEMVKEKSADLLGISATMTFHIPEVEGLISEIRSSDQFRKMKIMVGGYPFRLNPRLWKKVGADGWASDARKALKAAYRLVTG